MEKQRDKAAKRSQRKMNPTDTVDNDSEYLLDADGLPVLGEDGAPIRLNDGSGDGDGDDADAEDQDESQSNNN